MKARVFTRVQLRDATDSDPNPNTNWLDPSVWISYIFIIFMSWLFVLLLFHCSSGTAWTVVHQCHFFGTFYLFHWLKGTPFCDDQGIYDALTWWEQLDNGRQHTPNRKFLTLVPVVLYLITSYTTNYANQIFFFNTVAVFILVIAKFPCMHGIRIFGIND